MATEYDHLSILLQCISLSRPLRITVHVQHISIPRC
jgi:hypothetical protein